MMGKEELPPNAIGKGAIDQLIILDRSIDVMSALATQLTYEGLIGIAKKPVCLERVQNYQFLTKKIYFSYSKKVLYTFVFDF